MGSIMNFINSRTDTIGVRSPHNGAASEGPRSCAPMEAGCGDEQAAIVALRRTSPVRFTPWSVHEHLAFTIRAIGGHVKVKRFATVRIVLALGLGGCVTLVSAQAARQFRPEDVAYSLESR